MCGELKCELGQLEGYYGSSPRVWGTENQTSLHSMTLRFIPTCVGNWGSLSISGFIVSVHPHVCGELAPTQGMNIKYGGSSPRVWGTGDKGSMYPERVRFIPTCVGNCSMNGFQITFSTVHPHVCGELHANMLLAEAVIGSSPRVWGTAKFCQ